MLGIKDGPLRDGLLKDFRDAIAGLWAVPVNLPFTNFSRGLSASKRIRKVLAHLVKGKLHLGHTSIGCFASRSHNFFFTQPSHISMSCFQVGHITFFYANKSHKY